MIKNANLKWQECRDLGFRRDFSSNHAESTQPGEARSADADDRHSDDSNDVAAEESERL